MRVCALYRVSTERQESEGTSLDSQQAVYRDLAARNGWTTVAEFKGCESASQAASDRKVLQQVLRCLADEAPDAIWIIEQSRLTRGDPLETAMLFRELQERGTKLIVHSAVRSLDSVDERFVIGVQSLVDRAESERIKERMGRGRRERAKQGKKNCGPSPYGYRNPRVGEPGRGTLQVVPEEAVIVRRIFDMAAKGMGEKPIANALNAMGIPSPRGGTWGGTTVRRVLQCMAYTGVAASNVWVAEKGSTTFRFRPDNPRAIIIPDAHEPIVEREVWDQIHGRLMNPRTPTPRMLAGLLYLNGHAAIGDRGDGGAMYRGPRGMRGLPWLEVEHVEGAVWDAFVTLASGPELVGRLLEAAHNPKQQILLGQEIEHLGDQHAKAQRRLERLTEMRMDGEIDKDTYLRKRAETEGAVARLATELAGLRARAVVLDGTLATRVVRAVQTLLAGRTRLSGDQRRQVLRSIVRRIDVVSEREAGDFNRDERGRVLPGKVATWTVKRVTFDLTLPPADTNGDAAATGPRGASWANSAVAAGSGAPAREGATSGHGGEGGPGQLRTTPCFWAPPAPARP